MLRSRPKRRQCYPSLLNRTTFYIQSDFCPSHNFIVPPSESPSERLGTLETRALNLRLDSSLVLPLTITLVLSREFLTSRRVTVDYREAVTESGSVRLESKINITIKTRPTERSGGGGNGIKRLHKSRQRARNLTVKNGRFRPGKR